MKDSDKLKKLIENLKKHMNIIVGRQFLMGTILRDVITIIKYSKVDNAGGPMDSYNSKNSISEKFHTNWSLADWKQFRNRCLLSLR